jgi:carbonic anhydrase
MNPAGRRSLVVALVLVILIVLPSASVGGQELEWDYAAAGPHAWPELPGTSCNGAEQSPINIEPVTVAPADPGTAVEFAYARRAAVEVFNNGHAVEAEVPEGTGLLRFGGVEYELAQFHFHVPSEHELAGRDFEVEAHFVHRAEDGSLAVLAVLYRQGKPNKRLASIWRDLPDVDDSQRFAVQGVPLERLIPDAARVYHYSGSLTTPHCTEGVAWFVDARPDHLSRGQIKKLRGIFSGEEFPSGNARPVQRFKVDGVLAVGLAK